MADDAPSPDFREFVLGRIGGGSATGVALVAIYEEVAWRDYPFPSWDRVPFPNIEGIVIGNSTPESLDPTLDALPSTARVHSVTVPISEAMTTFTMQLDQPGQMLVAIDVSDGEVTVSAYARGFVDDASWRVVIGSGEPLPFEDFPFEQGESLFDDAVPRDGGVFGGGLVFGVTDTVTSADLDTDGSATIELPESRYTQLYVTTEGRGRFWLESTDPTEGAITGTGSPSSPENNFSGTLGRDDWWTSWTDQRATWPITARTDSGGDPERVVLRVEGYEEGSFELRVIGQFPEDEQP